MNVVNDPVRLCSLKTAVRHAWLLSNKADVLTTTTDTPVQLNFYQTDVEKIAAGRTPVVVGAVAPCGRVLFAHNNQWFTIKLFRAAALTQVGLTAESNEFVILFRYDFQCHFPAKGWFN